jgi:hypothetical protein
MAGEIDSDEVDDAEDDRSAEAAKFGAPNPDSWTRVFADDFNHPELPGWVNRPERSVASCGQVINGKLFVPPNDRSCRLTTAEHFGEGADSGKAYIFAASVKLHRTTGHFSSFWVTSAGVDPAFGDNNVNEIDIIENFGKLAWKNNPCGDSTVTSEDGKGFYGVQNVFYSAFGPPKRGHIHCFGEKAMGALKPFDGFHVYSAEWKPGAYIKYKMDGQKTAEFGPQFASSQAVSVLFTNITNSGDTSTIKGEGSRNLEVAWVRVWKHK